MLKKYSIKSQNNKETYSFYQINKNKTLCNKLELKTTNNRIPN